MKDWSVKTGLTVRRRDLNVQSIHDAIKPVLYLILICSEEAL